MSCKNNKADGKSNKSLTKSTLDTKEYPENLPEETPKKMSDPKNYKEKLYDKIPITLKTLDGIILIILGGLAAFFLYYLFL